MKQVSARMGKSLRGQQDRTGRQPQRAWALALALGVAGGCADLQPPAEEPGMALWFAALSSTGCQATTNGQRQLPAEVETLVAQWTAEVAGPTGAEKKTGKAKVARTKLAQGSWEVKGIPATAALHVEIFGCNKDKKVIYVGKNDGVQVTAGSSQPVRVFLAPSDKLACTGSPTGNAKLGAPRSLAGSAALSNGDAAIVGGLGTWDASFGSGEASAVVDLYDARLGHFRPSGKLSVARAQPHVHEVIKDGKSSLLVVGGALALQRAGDETKFGVKLMMPKTIESASTKAELLDLGGTALANRQSKADVGVGAQLFSSSIRLAKAILFVGGVSESGQILDQATRLNNLEDVAGGGTGTSELIKLNAARMRPSLLSFEDGSVLVWGGAMLDKGAPKAEAMGELIAAGSTVSDKLKLTGPAALLDDPNLSTVGAVVVPLARTADVLSLLVTGGIPVQSKVSTKDAPTYIVTVNKANKTAHIQQVSFAGDVKVRAGYGGIGVALDGGRILVGGGLVAATQQAEVCPSGGPAEDCALASAWVLRAPAQLPAGDAVVPMEVLSEVGLGGPRFGVAAIPLGLGALLAGGQVSTRTGSNAEVLDDVGEVLTLTPAALDQGATCN